MKILMLSWEYPPKTVGGLSNHVYNLSDSLNKVGHEVHVITCKESDALSYENNNGVHVHRVEPYRPASEDFVKWVMQLNFAMAEEAVKLLNKIGKVDVIHSHDWLTFFSAKLLKNAFNIPVACTFHATEQGRNGGIWTDMQKHISNVEWNLSYEAWKIITCSDFMKKEIFNLFSIPEDKVYVIPNGVDTDSFDKEFDEEEFKSKYAADNEKIVFFVGRHVYEKGVHLLIESSKCVIKSYKNVKFIVSGTGPMTEELISKVNNLGIGDSFIFTDFIDDETKNKLYKISSMAVFPSIYEPFGIVALEAMAAGCPVVVSDIGGFSEIVEHNYNGMKVIPNSVESLNFNILELLKNDNLAVNLRNHAYDTVEKKYTWNIVAERTAEVYIKIKQEAKNTEWSSEEENLEYQNLVASLGKISIKEKELDKKIRDFSKLQKETKKKLKLLKEELISKGQDSSILSELLEEFENRSARKRKKVIGKNN